mgnify:CR=1 FL=1
MELTENDKKNLKKLVQVIREMNRRGENPATSGNYSYRLDSGEACAVSESGVDKALFETSHFVEVDLEGQLTAKEKEAGRRSSAETALHTMIYQLFPQMKCVLHSHGQASLLFAEMLPPQQNSAKIEGMEMLKVLPGQSTHLTRVEIPLCENSQNMQEIIEAVRAPLNFTESAPAFIIRRHGLYTWGETVEEAWRHLEAFNYLFSFEIEKRKLQL